jgi:hypothetical protein
MTNDEELEKCKQALDKLPPSEREAVLSFARHRSRTPRLTTQKKDGKVAISNNHPDQMMGMLMQAQALGTGDLDFAKGVIEEIIDVSSFGREMNDTNLNFALSIIEGVRPQNPVQTLLATEMVANHRLLLQNAWLAATRPVCRSARALCKLITSSAVTRPRLQRFYTVCKAVRDSQWCIMFPSAMGARRLSAM